MPAPGGFDHASTTKNQIAQACLIRTMGTEWKRQYDEAFPNNPSNPIIVGQPLGNQAAPNPSLSAIALNTQSYKGGCHGVASERREQEVSRGLGSVLRPEPLPAFR
jgi:hypothetical protein